MSPKEQKTSIEEYHRRSGEMFLRKVYVVFSITLLSAFVIFYVHFGHHFGLNTFECDPIPSIDEMMSGTNENTFGANDSDMNYVNPHEAVDEDTSAENQSVKNFVEEKFSIIFGRMDANDRTYANMTDNFESIIRTNANLEIKMDVLSEKVTNCSADKEVLEIKQKMNDMKLEINQIHSGLKEIKTQMTQMNTFMSSISESIASSQTQTSEKSKKDKEKKKTK